MMADLAEAPLSSGQNITVCGLLSSLGGSAYVLEESATEMVAAQGFGYVEDAPRIPRASIAPCICAIAIPMSTGACSKACAGSWHPIPAGAEPEAPSNSAMQPLSVCRGPTGSSRSARLPAPPAAGS
jgi:hypothetical protein